MKRYPNIDNPYPFPFYSGSLSEHFSVEQIETFLEGKSAIKTILENFVGWTVFDRNLRLVLYFSVNRDYRGLPFVALIVCFSVVPLDRSNAPLILLKENASLIGPFHYSVILNNIVAVEFCLHAAFLSHDHLEHRLKQIIELALYSKQKFINPDFLQDLTDQHLTMPPYNEGAKDD